MRIRTFKKRALTTLLALAVVSCYSMVALAGDTKMAGEIVIIGSKDSAVTVNGETAKSGRTVFSSSTITTPADASAVISVKSIGKVKVAPSTTLVVNFDEKGITGTIEAGKLTVLDAVNTVNITAPNGKVAKLGSGESVITVQDDDDDNDPTPIAGISIGALVALIVGVGATAVAVMVYGGNSDLNQTGGVTVVSPTQ